MKKIILDFFNVKIDFRWHTPKLLDGLNCESKGEENERRRSCAHSLAYNISRVDGCVGAPRWD